MVIKFFRTFFLTFILIFIFFIGVSFHFSKKIFSKEVIKYNLINILYSQYGLTASFQDIKYKKPDNFTINDLTLISKDLNISIKTLSFNVDIFEIIKNRKLIILPRSFEIISMEARYINNKNKNYWSLRDYLKFFYNINTLSIKDSKILIIQNENNNKTIEINDLQASKSFFSDTVEIDFKGTYLFNAKKIHINSIFEIEENSIAIKKLITELNSKDIQLSGIINLTERLNTELEIKVNTPFDLKEIINIPHSIKINPFTSKAKGECINNIISFNIKIPSLYTSVDIIYDHLLNKFNEINIKSSLIDYSDIKEYIDEYVKNFNGKINLEINIKPQTHNYRINADSNNFSFTDLLGAINFKNTNGKLVITPDFHALNITQTQGIFPIGKITGSFQIEGNQNLEKIKTNLKLNGNYIKSNITIKNAKDYKDRNYLIELLTQNFSFQKMIDLSNYFKTKVNEQKIIKDSRYNFIDKPMKIKLISTGYEDEPYIAAKKIIINANYKNANEILKSNGEFKIKILDGQIKNIQQNIKENKIYELILLPILQIYKLNRTGALKIDYELKTINFSDMGSYFKTNNAKIVIDKFYLNSVEFLIYSRGEIDFNSKKINMNVYVINKKDFKRGALPETLTDAKGRPSLAFNISGSFEKNEIKIIDATNTTELVESEVKKSIDIEE